jgi:hypothetical protein
MQGRTRGVGQREPEINMKNRMRMFTHFQAWRLEVAGLG